MNIYTQDADYAGIESIVTATGAKLLMKSLKRELTETEKEDAGAAAYSMFLEKTLAIRVTKQTIVASDYTAACINAYVSAIRLPASRYDRSGLVYSDSESANRAAERGERYSRREFAVSDIERQAASLCADEPDGKTEVDVAACSRPSILERLCSRDEQIEALAHEKTEDLLISKITAAVGATVEQIVSDTALLRQAVQVYNNGCQALITAAEAAKMLGCTDKTLRNYAAKGLLERIENKGGRGLTTQYTMQSVTALAAAAAR